MRDMEAVEFMVFGIFMVICLVLSEPILRLNLWSYRKLGPAFLARSIEKHWGRWLFVFRILLAAIAIAMFVGLYLVK